MKKLTVAYNMGDVQITSEDISFAYLPNMYTKGRAGVGMQVNQHINKAACEKMCIKISEALLEYNRSDAQPLS